MSSDRPGMAPTFALLCAKLSLAVAGGCAGWLQLDRVMGLVR